MKTNDRLVVDDEEVLIELLQQEHRELSERLEDQSHALPSEEIANIKKRKLSLKDQLYSMGATTVPTRKRHARPNRQSRVLFRVV